MKKQNSRMDSSLVKELDNFVDYLLWLQDHMTFDFCNKNWPHRTEDKLDKDFTNIKFNYLYNRFKNQWNNTPAMYLERIKSSM